MRCLNLILVAMLGSALASCSAKNDSSPGAAQAVAEPKTLSSAERDPAPAPPKDAQWTIYCLSVSGINHVAQTNQLKADLMRTTSLRGWYVVHQEDHSVLYYGYYRSFKDRKDPKETARLQQDQKSIQAIADQLGNKPFHEAMPMLIASPDPVAPPEWDLRNAKGHWSLEIAVYLGSAPRKQAAVDAVRDARAQGVEAYYFHGPNVSSVCIGAFPEGAVTVTEPTQYMDDQRDQPVLVVGAGAGDVARGARGITDKNTNQPLKVLENRVDVNDPKLAAAMKQYPHHILNGTEELISIKGRDGKMIDQPKPSLLVPIPQKAPSALEAGAPAPEQPNLLSPQTDQDDLARRLRSVGSDSGSKSGK